jgi:hypothetical protein
MCLTQIELCVREYTYDEEDRGRDLNIIMTLDMIHNHHNGQLRLKNIPQPRE